MQHHPWIVLICLIMFAPSAQFAWRNQSMPQFAYLHDDGVLFTSAKSLAAADGYRIPSLPENPAQTKFPPLYPLYLSLIWKLSPTFPANLQLATWACWLALALFLALAWQFYIQRGFSGARAALLVVLLGVNPYLILFG